MIFLLFSQVLPKIFVILQVDAFFHLHSEDLANQIRFYFYFYFVGVTIVDVKIPEYHIPFSYLISLCFVLSQS